MSFVGEVDLDAIARLGLGLDIPLLPAGRLLAFYWMAHPVNAEPFLEALWAMHGNGPHHQIGGWADPVQGPVEYEVAQAALEESFDYGDRTHTEEALNWSLLLQVDSDDASDMMWGDVGMLYWLRRAAPNDSDELGTVSFTWQCS